VNAEDLTRRLLDARPRGLSGRFAVTFADGSDGERGVFLFDSDDRWVVRIDGAATLWSRGRRRFVRDASGTTSGVSAALPQRPPWSMVVPRMAPVFGRPGDDWQISEVLRAQGTLLEAELTSPAGAGRLVVDLASDVITGFATPSWTAEVVLGLPAADVGALQDVLRQHGD
jgi:hypothetical protein